MIWKVGCALRCYGLEIWKIERVLESLVGEFGKLSTLWCVLVPNLENWVCSEVPGLLIWKIERALESLVS